jgi:hypothetical protein
MMNHVNNATRAMKHGTPTAIPIIDCVLNFDPDAAVDGVVV